MPYSEVFADSEFVCVHVFVRVCVGVRVCVNIVVCVYNACITCGSLHRIMQKFCCGKLSWLEKF